jgi:hypothetical protein
MARKMAGGGMAKMMAGGGIAKMMKSGGRALIMMPISWYGCSPSLQDA